MTSLDGIGGLRLPSRVAEFLQECPKSGNGVHRFLFIAALKLHREKVSESIIVKLLGLATRNCGRPVSEREIIEAVRNSSQDTKDGASAHRPPPWPKPHRGRIREIAQAGPGVSGLRGLSPFKWSDTRPHTEQIIDLMFPGNPLLCVAQTKFRFNTMHRSAWRGRLASHQFIVPSPMSKVTGLTKTGAPSKHTLDNTGPRTFLVIEFDPVKWDQLCEAEKCAYGTDFHYYDAKRDEHAALLLHLSRFMPLTMVVHSGGKSLHGWFHCRGQDEVRLHRFMRYAVSLGADPATWIKSQFARMPDGWRDNRKRQSVLFFNPSSFQA